MEVARWCGSMMHRRMWRPICLVSLYGLLVEDLDLRFIEYPSIFFQSRTAFVNQIASWWGLPLKRAEI